MRAPRTEAAAKNARAVRRFALLAMTVVIALAVLPPSVRAGQAARTLAAKKATATPKTKKKGKTPPSIASVRYIKKGLTVKAPKKKPGKGKVKQKLYNQYFLSTNASQKASLGFIDGTVLHMNQRTDAVLRSPTVTQVNKGEVDEVLSPGTSHSILTATAVASAIGTEVDVKILKGKTIVTVVEGAVKLVGKNGLSVIVKTDQQSIVNKQGKPSPPTNVDSLQQTTWVNSVPPPPAPLGENIALDRNGGQIVSTSSERTSSTAGQFSAANLIDGDVSAGWESAQGQVTDQRIILSFSALATYTITKIVLDCAPQNAVSANDDLQHFQVLFSTTDTQDASFTHSFSGVCKHQSGLQIFTLDAPVQAKYVLLHALDNYGGTDGIAVAEIEVVSPDQVVPAHDSNNQVPTSTPTATPTNTTVPPTSTGTPLPSATNTPAPPTPTDTSLPTATQTPVPATPTNTAVPTVTQTPTPIPTNTFVPKPTSTPCNQPSCFS